MARAGVVRMDNQGPRCSTPTVLKADACADSEELMKISVNGTTCPLEGTAPHTNLLDFVRGQGFTGAKEGCAEGECGACAVLVARPDGDGGSRWVSINACLVPAAAYDGQEVVTAEGLGSPDDLHPVQAAMAKAGGSQCGYCTPGFVCSMAAEYYRPDRVAAQSRDHEHEHGPNGFDLHALSGNLCRCTGYRPIRDAAYELGDPAGDDSLMTRCTHPAPEARPTDLKDSSGRFVRPADLTAALALLADVPDALLVAGSTDHGVDVNIKGARPPLVIAIDRLAELRELDLGGLEGFETAAARPPQPPTSPGAVVPEEPTESASRRPPQPPDAAAVSEPPDSPVVEEGRSPVSKPLTLGAALTLSEIEQHLGERVPLLNALWPQFASRLIRNGATLGGNLGTGSPIGDAPPALLALEASLILASAQGEREVALKDYFTGYRETVKRNDELIKAITIPLPLAKITAFHKIAKRRFDDISSVAVAYAFDVEDGVITKARIGLGGVAATPIRAYDTEAALEGRPWTKETVEAAATILEKEGTPMGDHRASAPYRKAMLRQSLRMFGKES
jgi:xanthine dehydrogenase small subunit